MGLVHVCLVSRKYVGTSPGISWIVAPSSAGSRIFHSQLMPSSLNLWTMTPAMASKFSVARASIVGPAPERQIPSKPLWVLGDMEDKMAGKAGIKVLR